MDGQVNAQHWLDQLICPECKGQYPERSIQYTSVKGLNGHRAYRHGVIDPSLEANYPRNDAGKFLCLHEGCIAAVDNPLLLGKHRWYAHGIRGKTYLSRKRAESKTVKPAKKETHGSAPVQKLVPVEVRGPSEMVVVYLFGKVENQIENYANQYGLQAKTLFAKVGELLQAAGK